MDSKGKEGFHFLNITGISTDEFGQTIVDVNDTSTTDRQQINLKDLISIDVTTIE